MFGTPSHFGPERGVPARRARRFALMATAVATCTLGALAPACAATQRLFEQSYDPGERRSREASPRIELRSVLYTTTGVELVWTLMGASADALAPGSCWLMTADLAYAPRDLAALPIVDDTASWRGRFELGRPLRDEARLRCHEVDFEAGAPLQELLVSPVPSAPPPGP